MVNQSMIHFCKVKFPRKFNTCIELSSRKCLHFTTITKIFTELYLTVFCTNCKVYKVQVRDFREEEYLFVALYESILHRNTNVIYWTFFKMFF